MDVGLVFHHSCDDPVTMLIPKKGTVQVLIHQAVPSKAKTAIGITIKRFTDYSVNRFILLRNAILPSFDTPCSAFSQYPY
jgi:hypothetical protein